MQIFFCIRYQHSLGTYKQNRLNFLLQGQAQWYITKIWSVMLCGFTNKRKYMYLQSGHSLLLHWASALI